MRYLAFILLFVICPRSYLPCPVGRVYTPPLVSMAGAGCGRFYVLVGSEEQIVEVDLIMCGKALDSRVENGC